MNHEKYLTKDNLSNHIWLRDDAFEPYIVGYDKIPTIEIPIEDTTFLNDAADEMFHELGYAGTNEIDDLWYDFYVSLYKLNGEIKCKNRIEFIPSNHEIDDVNGVGFYIDLSEGNQKLIIERISQLIDLDEAFKEAEIEMEYICGALL